ncbi:MAG: hypothetical protein WA672_06575 [Candidatus Angelobacter sp.]
MSESEFWNDLQYLTVEVEDAKAIYYTYNEINSLAAQKKAVLNAFNRDALFWNVQALCLQTSLFIILSRIFDENENTLSIHRIVNATLGHPEFFSKKALTHRKHPSGPKPEWLDEFISDAWAPRDASELRYIKKALKPHTKRFVEIYRPIRHAYFGHRIIGTQEPIPALFALTNKAELAQMLDFLHELVDAITNLYQNGVPPEIGVRKFEYHNGKIKNSTRSVINKIAKAYSKEE